MGWFCLEHLCPITPICWSLFVRLHLIELLCTDLSNREAWVEMFYTLEKGMPFLHVTLTYDSASQPFTCTQITWGACENAGSDSRGLRWGLSDDDGDDVISNNIVFVGGSGCCNSIEFSTTLLSGPCQNIDYWNLYLSYNLMLACFKITERDAAKCCNTNARFGVRR